MCITLYHNEKLLTAKWIPKKIVSVSRKTNLNFFSFWYKINQLTEILTLIHCIQKKILVEILEYLQQPIFNFRVKLQREKRKLHTKRKSLNFPKVSNYFTIYTLKLLTLFPAIIGWSCICAFRTNWNNNLIRILIAQHNIFFSRSMTNSPF